MHTALAYMQLAPLCLALCWSLRALTSGGNGTLKTSQCLKQNVRTHHTFNQMCNFFISLIYIHENSYGVLTYTSGKAITYVALSPGIPRHFISQSVTKWRGILILKCLILAVILKCFLTSQQYRPLLAGKHSPVTCQFTS